VLSVIQITLTDGARRTFDTTALDVKRTGGTTLSFTIPAGAASGPATLEIGAEGSVNTVRAQLVINRLLFARFAKSVALHVVSPRTVTPLETQLDLESSILGLSLAQGGGQLGVLTTNQAELFRLTLDGLDRDRARILRADLTGANPTCFAAMREGVIVAKAADVAIYSVAGGQGQQWSVAGPKNVKAIAVDAAETVAALLHPCPTTPAPPDPVPDCISAIQLGGEKPTLGPSDISLQNNGTATTLALSPNGLVAVTADQSRPYAVTLASGKISADSWGTTVDVVVLDQAASDPPIARTYGVADSKNKRVWFIGFAENDPNTIRRITWTVDLDAAPLGLGFVGDYRDVYVATASTIYRVQGAKTYPLKNESGQITTALPPVYTDFKPEQPLQGMLIQP
jgi:hypothetical protein